MVMEPSRTWATNSLTRSLPRSLASPKRPCSTIWSSRLACSWVSTAAAWPAALAAVSGMGTSVADLGLQLVQFFGIADGFEEELFELVVALEGAAQVAEAGAQVHQF